VYQIVATTSTSTYPFKFFSVASTTKSSTNWATSTEYIFNGDTLLATVDQQFKNGTATGTAKTRYVHPVHLGSTNVVTDVNDNVVQTLDYYPYGATRVSVSTSTNEKRKFIGQFTDDSGLDYLNARYYSSDRGQFISQDPSFLSVGDPNQVKQVTGRDQQTFLADPQLVNSYNYGRDNPISFKDPQGNIAGIDDAAGLITGGVIGVGMQVVQSRATGQPLTFGSVAGAFVSGGIISWGAANAPETGGLSLTVASAVAYGGVGGLAGNGVKQVIDVRTGAQNGYDVRELGVSTGTGAFFGGLTEGALPNARIPILSTGRNSMYAVGKAMQTRIANGYANTMSMSTAFKSAVGSQAANSYKTIFNTLMEISRTLSTMAQQQKAVPQK
jgi:RHS repeat-associated protein